jgi:hypothetical protein
MIFSGQPDLGFSLNPIKAVKSAAKGVAKGAKAVGKGTVAAAKATGKGALKYGKYVFPVQYLTVWAASKAGQFALRPVKAKVQSLTARRAQKLARDRRHPRPTPADQAEARSWNKAHLKKQGPQGYILAALAGAPVEVHPMGGSFGEPITVATIVAMIPVLLKLVSMATSKASASGEISAEGPGGSVSAGGGVEAQADPSFWQNVEAAGKGAVSAGQRLVSRGQQYAAQAKAKGQEYRDIYDQSKAAEDARGEGGGGGGIHAEINVDADAGMDAEGGGGGGFEGANTSNLGYGIAIGIGVLALGTGLFCALRH